ncbi:LOW QUALITY PROTEIN: G-type lectin S-receptor-like serine/threonine-protein kinase At1g11330 [Prosopis cineraria]|uniref:LOW QUALITY PROTEIN: G-type lectin S-receptor-like serine/threonine-protein kinase At1g11330 n=1 Tax=Prosopis cineraria TaxID=364024 RepID=UPI00241038D6|nr:LOW QUALITY PROTEIN: G-type lectin S-receptor-like serine/threonine-protein kinase At1g11330 [Prosopis cineraria]
MFLTGFGSSSCSLLPFFIHLFSFSALVCALDTVTPSLEIHEPKTIRSNNGMFTLGFFSPENSTNRYLGIWLMSESTIVWVANRDDPVTDSSRILTISDNGNLVVLNGQKQVVWSTNVSHIASNSSVQLLDSGNLVLTDRTAGAMVWQSFRHPCDTLLQDLKLSTNQQTGEKVKLTSWKSTSDPSHGRFSLGLGHLNFTQVFIWKENSPHWRSGPWNGTNFLGIPGTSSMIGDGFQVKEDEGIFEVSFHFTDKSLLMTFALDSQGKLSEHIWDFQKNAWELRRRIGDSECDFYGKCGPFGICNSQSSPICSCLRGFEPKNKEEWEKQNWTNGCVRREALQCVKNNNGSQATSTTDGFFKLERVKVPDQAESLPYNFRDVVDCRTPCLKSCSCKAYAFDPGLGCMVWNVDLLDILSNSPGGVDLYLRLASSELDTVGRSNMTAPIVISVLTGTIVIIASGFFLWQKWSKQKGGVHKQIVDEKEYKTEASQIQELSLFDFRKLATATNNFDLANKIGQGGFGPVYKGKLEAGQEIAVKRLSRSSGQGVEEFISEVELISKLQHRNLVRLLGCCMKEEEILVYEYLPNKSLDAYIFAVDPLQQKYLDWGKRFNIIEGIARGLLYLHRDSRLRIIHRNVKASNILLDKEMNAKISDFGTAKLFQGDQDRANTKRIVGTFGYISPEYATEGFYSEKSDVFSFGVLLLEIISGRKNTSFYEDAECLTLLGFAWKLWMDANVIPLIDPQIYDPNFQNDILRCIHIGLLCVQELAKDRPPMASVLSMLQSEIIDIPPPRQPAFIFRQTMSCAAEKALENNELCSINIVTMSHFEGR